MQIRVNFAGSCKKNLCDKFICFLFVKNTKSFIFSYL